MTHSTQQIATAAAALGNQLKAGLPMEKAARRLAGMQPGLGWDGAAGRIARGEPLSECLRGAWPESWASAVAAGERSGALPEIFAQIEEAISVQHRIAGHLRQLRAPLLLSCGGVAVFVFFMSMVIPAVSSSLSGMLIKKAEPSLVMAASAWTHQFLLAYWPAALAAAAASLSGAIWAFRQPGFIEWLFQAADEVPVLGAALRDLYFGLWARNLAVLACAGNISIVEMLLLSSKILPAPYQSGPLSMAGDVVQRGMEEAGDPDKQAAGDPRARWPYYIGIAFSVASQTGRLDVEMSRVSPILVEDGRKAIESFIKTASFLALLISGALIMAPLAAYYLEMGNLVRQAMR